MVNQRIEVRLAAEDGRDLGTTYSVFIVVGGWVYEYTVDDDVINGMIYTRLL